VTIFIFTNPTELIKLISPRQPLPPALEDQLYKSKHAPVDLRNIGQQFSKIINPLKRQDNVSTFGFTCYILNEVLETPLRSVILEALESKADFKTPFEYGGENQEIDLHTQLFSGDFSYKEKIAGFEDLLIKTSKLGIVKRHLPGESGPQINLVIHLVGEKSKNTKGATPERFDKTLEVPIIGNLDFGKGAIIDIRDPQESFNSILEKSS
jgi:hypothetical protein